MQYQELALIILAGAAPMTELWLRRSWNLAWPGQRCVSGDSSGS